VNFYKILNKEETHNGLKYHDGLNEDPLPFNPSGDCEPGGIYFTREDILAFLSYGPWIRQVTLPEGEPVYENPGSPKKWKAKRVILGPRRKIDLQVIKELVEEGANIRADNDQPLVWAAENGYLDIVKFLADKSTGIHTYNNQALVAAAKSGHLHIIKYLVEEGVDIRRNQNEALIYAALYGHLEVVKFLVTKGANIHALRDAAVRYAAEYGRFNVVKYLTDNGADIHVENDYATMLLDGLRQMVT